MQVRAWSGRMARPPSGEGSTISPFTAPGRPFFVPALRSCRLEVEVAPLARTVHDIAAYILRQAGEMTAMKLQKLVYYAQAWSLVWDERPLFGERIEAWANGPVARDLYDRHRGRFQIADWPDGDPDTLSAQERETVDAVLDYYAPHPSQALSDLTHREAPWREARRGLPPGERGRQEISHASMAEYYGGLESPD